MKADKKISIEMTEKEYVELQTALSVCQELEHLFDGVDERYMNKLGDTVDILLDIINCEGKFICRYETEV